MSEALRYRVRELLFPLGHYIALSDKVYDFVLSEIARAQREGQNEVTIQHRIVRQLEHQTERERHIMIAIEKLKASSDALTAAVTGAIALIPSGTPASTPDINVLAFQSDVDAQTSRLLAAEGPAPTPAPAPAPGA